MNIVGVISQNVITVLGLSVSPGTPIFIGQSNIEHMKNKHPAAYAQYGGYIGDILNAPDYVGINPGDGSIEYVKEFILKNDFVKVAVRVAGSGNYYARSIYVLNLARVNKFIAKGTLKPL